MLFSFPWFHMYVCTLKRKHITVYFYALNQYHVTYNVKEKNLYVAFSLSIHIIFCLSWVLPRSTNPYQSLFLFLFIFPARPECKVIQKNITVLKALCNICMNQICTIYFINSLECFHLSCFCFYFKVASYVKQIICSTFCFTIFFFFLRYRAASQPAYIFFFLLNQTDVKK